jgi:hypothetical protein
MAIKRKAKAKAKAKPKIVKVALPHAGVVRIVAPPGVLPVIAPSKPGVVEIVPIKRPLKRTWWDQFWNG